MYDLFGRATAGGLELSLWDTTRGRMSQPASGVHALRFSAATGLSGPHTTDTSLIGCREMLALYLSVSWRTNGTPPRPCVARCGVSEARSALVLCSPALL